MNDAADKSRPNNFFPAKGMGKPGLKMPGSRT
jgi:hypothetical protein